MSKLHIGEGFTLPLEFVTQSQAILAKKRVGKTYTAKVQAEELLKAKQQVVAIDPTGAWWGLKSSADGKQPGFSLAVFGGEHADIPLGGKEIRKDELAEQTGFSPNSGGFNNYVGHMATLGFIEYAGRGVVRCAEWMFL